jgi:hypothetical protein
MTISKPNDNKSEKNTLENKDIYKTAFDTRNLEISLFWQRSNYFLVLNSALALGFFNLQKQEYAFLLALFGLLVSFLWYRVNLGSKYWQSRWEERLAVIEKQVAPELHFFAADWKIIQEDVKASLANSQSKKGWFQKWLDKQILSKPSVSYNMTLLSLLFLLGWVLLIAIRICKGNPLSG